jgi:hypothetical protein
MASAVLSAANRLSAREDAGPRTLQSKGAMRRSPLRQPPAELRRTPPNRPRGGSRENPALAKQSRFIE